MTHAELVSRSIRWLSNTKGCSIAFGEFFSAAYECPDAIGFQNQFSILIECKVSRSDFFADRHKPFRRIPSLGMGAQRYFMTPPGLVAADELPAGWGLLEVHSRHVKVVRESKGFPDRARNREISFLVSMLRRAQIRIDRPLSG